jgi:hypothetical protein
MDTYNKLPAIVAVLGAAALAAGPAVSGASPSAEQQQASQSDEKTSGHAAAKGSHGSSKLDGS